MLGLSYLLAAERSGRIGQRCPDAISVPSPLEGFQGAGSPRGLWEGPQPEENGSEFPCASQAQTLMH